MLQKKTIRCQLSPAFKDRIKEHVGSSDLSIPVPSISWGKWEDETDEHFFLGYYERSQLPEQDPIRFVEIDDIEFIIIQDWICDKLEGKRLDINEHGIVLEDL